MPEATFVHPLFGNIRFRTQHLTWVRGDHITFMSGFNTADIEPLTIPQLRNVPGTHNGRLQFHKRAHAQVLAVFADIERLGLLRHIKTCAGSVNFRLRKPTSGALSKTPSNHSFGIAIDLNSDDGSLGATVAPVAPVFEAFDFKWGKSFNDPMHFEVERFLDHARPSVQDVSVVLNDKDVDLGAKNMMGNLVMDVAKSEALPGISVEHDGSKISVKGPAGSRKLPVQRFGDSLGFVSLPLLSGIADLRLNFNNDTKVAQLTNVAEF